jgi:phosphoserine aminotransferase
VDSVGGLEGTMARSNENVAVIDKWVAKTHWVDYLARVPETRSNTSVCLKIVDPEIEALSPAARDAVPRQMAALLDAENVAKDIAPHRASPPGLRVWTGATVEKSDLEALMPWLDWAFAEVKRTIAKAA